MGKFSGSTSLRSASFLEREREREREKRSPAPSSRARTKKQANGSSHPQPSSTSEERTLKRSALARKESLGRKVSGRHGVPNENNSDAVFSPRGPLPRASNGVVTPCATPTPTPTTATRGKEEGQRPFSPTLGEGGSCLRLGVFLWDIPVALVAGKSAEKRRLVFLLLKVLYS